MYELIKHTAIVWGHRMGLDKRGVTALEYGLIAAAVALAILAAVRTLGTNLGLLFNNVSGNLHQ